MGVITVTTIDYGQIYGPLPQTGTDVIGHIAQVTCLPKSQSPPIRINLEEISGCESQSWMYQVSAAHNEDEQNMEAYVKDGHLYYRCLRMIRENEELLVWYSKDLSLLIGILDIPRHRLVEKDELVCPLCGEVFEEPFPLRAHIRFKCTVKCSDISLFDKKAESTNSMSDSEDIFKRKRRFNEDTHSNSYKSQNNNNIDDVCASKKAAPDEFECNITVAVDDRMSEVDVNQNVRADPDRSSHSAFTKVSKSLQNNDTLAVESFAAKHYSSTSSFSPSSTHAYRQYETPTPSMKASLPIIPMLSSLGMQRFMQYMAHEGTVGNNSISMNHKETLITLDRDSFHKAIHMTQSPSLPARNLANLPVTLDKTSFPFVRTANPMIDKLLHSLSPTIAHLPLTAIPMTQNWCAQCNATFRMTSDLVYHMRSHHQREFDPIKKKREDKLRCGVCREGFRERHHLTRHMTSHL